MNDQLELNNTDEEMPTTVIQAQNNMLEMGRELRRMEKLFYFFRDFDSTLKDQNPLKQLMDLRDENTKKINEIVSFIQQPENKFIQRLDRTWSKFLSTNSKPSEE